MIAEIRKEFEINDNYLFFGIFLRFIAALLITNSHYSKVYPLEILASGGLLGDVIFFAISGLGLVNIKKRFDKWYKRRLMRIYPAVILVTAFFLLINQYSLNSDEFILISIFKLFIYPSYYHFIASIVVLYILYYIVLKINYFRNNLSIVVFFILLIQLICYILFFDKTFYHIDNVREIFIRFIFFEAMLIGAHYRLKSRINVDKLKTKSVLILIILMVSYFLSKLLFSQGILIPQFQIVNQFILLLLLNYIFKVFSSLENKIRQLPYKIKYFINFIATITLEIYLVQYVIIEIFSSVFFPINWLIITSLIVVSAFILHILVIYLRRFSLKINNINEGAK